MGNQKSLHVCGTPFRSAAVESTITSLRLITTFIERDTGEIVFNCERAFDQGAAH